VYISLLIKSLYTEFTIFIAMLGIIVYKVWPLWKSFVGHITCIILGSVSFLSYSSGMVTALLYNSYYFRKN